MVKQIEKTTLTRTGESRGSRTRNPTRTRELILRAAKELFCRSDYGSVALSDIAKHAGVTQSLIHHYFKTKSRLFLYAVHSAMNDYDQGLDDWVAPGLNTPDIIPKAIEGYFRFLAENELCVRLYRLFDHSLDIDPSMLKSLVELEQSGETGNLHRIDNLKTAYDRIVELQQQGRLRPGMDPKALVLAILSLVEHWHSSSQRLNHRLTEALGQDNTVTSVTAEEYLSTVINLFMHGALVDKVDNAGHHTEVE